MPYNYNTKVK